MLKYIFMTVSISMTCLGVPTQNYTIYIRNLTGLAVYVGATIESRSDQHTRISEATTSIQADDTTEFDLVAPHYRVLNPNADIENGNKKSKYPADNHQYHYCTTTNYAFWLHTTERKDRIIINVGLENVYTLKLNRHNKLRVVATQELNR